MRCPPICAVVLSLASSSIAQQRQVSDLIPSPYLPIRYKAAVTQFADKQQTKSTVVYDNGDFACFQAADAIPVLLHYNKTNWEQYEYWPTQKVAFAGDYGGLACWTAVKKLGELRFRQTYGVAPFGGPCMGHMSWVAPWQVVPPGYADCKQFAGLGSIGTANVAGRLCRTYQHQDRAIRQTWYVDVQSRLVLKMVMFSAAGPGPRIIGYVITSVLYPPEVDRRLLTMRPGTTLYVSRLVAEHYGQLYAPHRVTVVQLPDSDFFIRENTAMQVALNPNYKTPRDGASSAVGMAR